LVNIPVAKSTDVSVLHIIQENPLRTLIVRLFAAFTTETTMGEANRSHGEIVNCCYYGMYRIVHYCCSGTVNDNSLAKLTTERSKVFENSQILH
jgi:hypothetical protein